MRHARFFCVALTACGSANTLTDAAQYDDAGADNITVIVNATSGPLKGVQGVPVVFVNPDGHVAAEKMTDPSGMATASILPGASITAVYGATLRETVREVAPGDTIVIGPINYSGTAVGQFTVNVPDYAGSSVYDVYGRAARMRPLLPAAARCRRSRSRWRMIVCSHRWTSLRSRSTRVTSRALG